MTYISIAIIKELVHTAYSSFIFHIFHCDIGISYYKEPNSYR